MQKTTSQKALKVISIIMIVFAALTLLLGIGGIVTGGALGILGAGIGDAGSAALVGGVAAVAGFVILLGGAINLAIGIFGLRGANDPRKIGAFYAAARTAATSPAPSSASSCPSSACFWPTTSRRRTTCSGPQLRSRT